MRPIDRMRERMEAEHPPYKPARERILDAVAKICSKGTWLITDSVVAECAKTNTDVVVREFGSVDRLIGTWLEGVAKQQAAERKTFTESRMNDQENLRAWLDQVVERLKNPATRRCIMSEAALQFMLFWNLRPPQIVCGIVRKAKTKEFADLTSLCRRADYDDPMGLAFKLLLLIEGARVCAVTLGESGPVNQVKDAISDILRSHPNSSDDGTSNSGN